MSERPPWPKEVRAKSCARCGAALTCGTARGEERCWCDARPHVPLLKDFGDCLCPSCLDDEIAKATAK
jgi:hypothetical protein